MSERGRPRIHDPAIIGPLFARYIQETEIPIVAEFAAQQGYGKHVIYDMADDSEEFANLLRQCITKKEGALEAKGLRSEINNSMAIFSLKQLGWTDKQDTTLKGDKDNPIQISDASAKW